LTTSLEAKKVSFTYPDGTEALKEVNIELRAGKVTALVGPNGSGKSTLLLVLAGLLEPSEGEVLFNGQAVLEMGVYYRKKCGLLFQNPSDQLLAPTVWEDVAIAPSQLGLRGKELELVVDRALKKVGALDLRNRSPHRLSHGQAARVALAGIIAQSPFILLLDEPSSSLDAEGLKILEELINKAKKQGKIVGIASQDTEFIARVADEVYVLAAGMIVSHESSKEVLSNVDLLRRIGIKAPPAVRIYKALLETNGRKAPITEEELIELLKECLRGIETIPERASTDGS